MRGFTIHLESGYGRGAGPAELAAFIRNGLRDLSMANLWAYRTDPTLPSVYEAGVVYRREAPGHEQFADVATLLRRGHGDCEDLATAVAAWRTVRTGERCEPQISWKPLSATHWLFHITVRRANGATEDPSALLGMNDEPGTWVLRGRTWVYQLSPGRSGLVPEPAPFIERRAA